MPTDDQALNQVASLYSLRGKKGLVLGIANQQSIAWGCAQLARQLGADVVATCLNDKARKYVEPLTEPLGIDLINCNVEDEGALSALVNHAAERLGHIDFVIHSIAWAPLEDLHGRVIDSSSVGFARDGGIVPFLCDAREAGCTAYEGRRQHDYHDLSRC